MRQQILICLLTMVFQAPMAISQTHMEAASLLATLTKYSTDDTQAGLSAYSRALTNALVGDRLGTAFPAAFSDRLARSELMARHGKRKLVPERGVAQAFNDLVQQAGAPASMQTNEQEVHGLRQSVEETSPALTSLSKNGAVCGPGEAVFILIALLTGRDATGLQPSQALVSPENLPRLVTSVRDAPNAGSFVAAYLSQHSRGDGIRMFDRTARLLGL